MTEPDTYGDMFRFPLGQVVRWAEYPDERHYIKQRRWTQRAILGPVVEYRVSLGRTRSAMGGWIPETDLMLWEDEP